jgi:hypothetical protein
VCIIERYHSGYINVSNRQQGVHHFQRQAKQLTAVNDWTKTPTMAKKLLWWVLSNALLPTLLMVPFSSAAFLPDGPIIIGYQNWDACDRNDTLTAVGAGVNVVIWFAINLVDNNGSPGISGGPDTDCFASIAAEIDDMGLETSHLISIGGWDAPHPDASYSGQEFFDAFADWNLALPRPFDGFDWDLEGNDDSSSSNNVFTSITLNQMVDMSVAAKLNGLVVTMVPAQSYFDSTTSEFNLSLLNNYPDYHSEFFYHGMNCYAYVYVAAPSDTFDLVTVQLYESWSRANEQLINYQVPAPLYLTTWWGEFTSEWNVEFGNNETTGLRLSGVHPIVVPPSKLVVGFSRGDSQGKSAFIWPEDAGIAYESTLPIKRPRGFAFWNIAEEGSTANGTNVTLAFAPTLNSFLHIR